MATQVSLAFGGGQSDLTRDLSAGARVGDTLFLANDETASIEALDWDGDCWRLVDSIPLKSLVHLPGGGTSEADLEAMAADNGWLWITGSHAQVREKVSDDGPKKAVRRLGSLSRPPNRCVLARIPIVQQRAGRARLAAEADGRRTEQMEAGKRSSTLIRWIADDAMIAPFIDLGTKENGLEIEGLAANADTLWLGLRGPVVRGHAVILRLQISGGRRGALKAKKLEEGRRFRKYLLPLDGLGIRDLACDGEDLLILTGPTMAVEGPHKLVRWKDAGPKRLSQVIDRDDLSTLADLTAPGGEEKAEGLVPWDDGRFLLLHDSPSDRRVDALAGIYKADLVRVV